MEQPFELIQRELHSSGTHLLSNEGQSSRLYNIKYISCLACKQQLNLILCFIEAIDEYGLQFKHDKVIKIIYSLSPSLYFFVWTLNSQRYSLKIHPECWPRNQIGTLPPPLQFQSPSISPSFIEDPVLLPPFLLCSLPRIYTDLSGGTFIQFHFLQNSQPTSYQQIPVCKCQLRRPRNKFYRRCPVSTPCRISEVCYTRKSIGTKENQRRRRN